MALKLIEGFDHLSTPAKFSQKAWSFSTGGAGTNSLQVGRIGGQCVRLQLPGTAGTHTSTLTKVLPGTYTTCIAGVGFRHSRQIGNIFILRNGGTNTCQAIFNGSNISIFNSSGTLIATGTTNILTNTWYYLEIKLVVNGASGSVAVQLNGAPEIATTTGNFGSLGITNVLMTRSYTATAETSDYDDLYVCDNSGSVNNNFLGDVRVQTIYPDGDGAHTDFTPDSGSTHFNRVNDTSGDDDTSYVASSTATNRDSYTYGPLTQLSGTVFGVQTNLWARKDDAATRQLAPVVRPASTDYDGTTVTLTTTYVDYPEIKETNPDTSTLWTISDINNGQFGVKVVT